MNDSAPHKTVQLSIVTRVPEWARWYAVEEDGSIRVFKFKPSADLQDLLWFSRKDEEAGLSIVGHNCLRSIGPIRGDGLEDHAPDWESDKFRDYFRQHPRVDNWHELVFPIRKADHL